MDCAFSRGCGEDVFPGHSVWSSKVKELDLVWCGWVRDKRASRSRSPAGETQLLSPGIACIISSVFVCNK